MVNPSSNPESVHIYQQSTFTRENSMGYLMRRIGTMMVAEVDQRLIDLGLTHAQWAPLVLIGRGKASTQAELARELQLDAGALTRTLDRLEAKGLCRRERSTEDRRVVHLALTPEGEAATAPVPAVLCDVSNTLLSGFNRDEFEVLMGFLRRMHANAEAMRQLSESQHAASTDGKPAPEGRGGRGGGRGGGQGGGRGGRGRHL